MRAVVCDTLGKTKVVDIWNNRSSNRFGGDADGKANGEWGVNVFHYESINSVIALHNSGYISKFDMEASERKELIKLREKSKGLAVSSSIAVFEDSIHTFSGEQTSLEIDTASCASIMGNSVAVGRIEKRTEVYDVASQKPVWTADKPPLDELKLPLQDSDRSILFMDGNTLLVGQNDCTILLYDIRSGSQPAVRYHPFEEFPVVALAKINENLFACGDTVGSLLINDIRAAEIKGYKGFDGAPSGVSCISPHPSLPMLSILSQDRVIRLYDYSKEQRTHIKEAFTKTKSLFMVMLDDEIPVEEDSSEDDWANLPEDSEDVWEGIVASKQ